VVVELGGKGFSLKNLIAKIESYHKDALEASPWTGIGVVAALGDRECLPDQNCFGNVPRIDEHGSYQ
jgi:hypothetical protein